MTPQVIQSTTNISVYVSIFQYSADEIVNFIYLFLYLVPEGTSVFLSSEEILQKYTAAQCNGGLNDLWSK